MSLEEPDGTFTPAGSRVRLSLSESRYRSPHSSKCKRERTGVSLAGTSSTKRVHWSCTVTTRQLGLIGGVSERLAGRRAMGAKRTHRSIKSGCFAANRPAGIDPQECEMIDNPRVF